VVFQIYSQNLIQYQDNLFLEQEFLMIIK